MRARAENALALLQQPDLSPGQRVSQLSPAARQLVEIARALVFEARVVVMDEPTSSLSQRDVEQLFTVVQRLCSHGVAVIYISHFLEEVRRIAQRYTVLRDGRPARVDYGEVDHCCQRFSLMDGWLDQAGRQAHGTVGHAPARLARGRDILEAALAHLAADETVFLHPPGTDAECDAARASLPRNATSSGDSRS